MDSADRSSLPLASMRASVTLGPLMLLALGGACGGGLPASDDASTGDAGTMDGAPSDASDADGALLDSATGTDSATGMDAGADAGSLDAGTCAPGFHAMLSYDQADDSLGTDFLSWRRSVVDDTHSVSHGRAVRVRTNPGAELLPACSGGLFFAGRRRLPAPVPQGSTIWFRIFQYIPSEFSFGFKYTRSTPGDCDAATACSQQCDGSGNLKWLVFAPDMGTARVYLVAPVVRRDVRSSRPRIRIISEALHRPGDFAGVDLPRDRWFSLQMAVRVSDGDDGFIRAWIDDEYLGEVMGPTTVTGASINEWGMGDYWNGVPWTDGAAGRTDFWVDEVIVASDAPGYDTPTGVDDVGHAFIPSCMRVSDLAP